MTRVITLSNGAAGNVCRIDFWPVDFTSDSVPEDSRSSPLEDERICVLPLMTSQSLDAHIANIIIISFVQYATSVKTGVIQTKLDSMLNFITTSDEELVLDGY